MKFTLLNNEKGLTIAELIIAMGISAILLIFIISGSLFVETYLNKQKLNSNLYEEVSFIGQTIGQSIQHSKELYFYDDSLIVYSIILEKTVFFWSDTSFVKNNQNLLTQGYKIESLNIKKIELQKTADTTILNSNKNLDITGVYELLLKISDAKNNSNKTKMRILNHYESTKYNQ